MTTTIQIDKTYRKRKTRTKHMKTVEYVQKSPGITNENTF